MSTTPDVTRTKILENAHDFEVRELKIVETDKSTQNIQRGGVSVLNNNTYHQGSHHSNPIFHGNSDGSPTIVYYNHGPVSDPARLQSHFGPAMHVRYEQRERPAPRPYQYRGGGRGYWPGLPPPSPPPPRPPPRPSHSDAGGVYATQQQRSFHGQHQQQTYDERYEEYVAGSYTHDPHYEDTQYHDSQYRDSQYWEYQDSQHALRPQYQQHPQRQQYPQQYPHDQQQAYPASSPKSYFEYPPSPSMHGSPVPPFATQAQPYSRLGSTNSYYQRQEGSNSNGSLPRAQRQDTNFSTPPQSPGLPPEQFEDVNEARGSPQQPVQEFRRESTTRSESDRRIKTVPEEARSPAPCAPPSLAASAPEPRGEPSASEPAPLAVSAVADQSSPPTRSSERGKSKKRGSWISTFFKGSSKGPNLKSRENKEGVRNKEYQSRSKRGSILRFGKN